MNWQIEWGGEPVFGYDFAWILADGIEDGMAELDYLQTYGEYCEACGEFRICNTHIGESLTPTDRGMLREESEKLLCEECYDHRICF